MILYSMLEFIAQLDTSFFFFINKGFQNRFLDGVMPFITQRSYLFLIPFVLVLLVREPKKTLAVFTVAFCSFLLADAVGNGLKNILQRVRPCHVYQGINLLVGCGGSFSLPSNHAANSVAFAVPFLALMRSPLRHAFALVAGLVCFSRVYVGVHYPLDVAAGAALGAALAAALIGLYRWAEHQFATRPAFTVMAVLMLGISIFRVYYILDGPLDLSPDEAHYWEWSRRLDLSYYSKGPAIAYLIALGTTAFGDTVFGVRALAVILSLISGILLYRLGKELYDETTGAAAAVLLQLVPLFSAFGVVFSIDSPFIFFWVLSLYLFWRVVRVAGDRSHHVSGTSLSADNNAQRPPSAQWILLGISVGLGLLTKYTMAFFVISAFLFLLSSPGGRAMLRTARPYISLLVSLIVFSPVLVWNADHAWVTFRHTAGQANLAGGLDTSIKTFFEFLGSQIGVITPILFIFMSLALWKTDVKENRRFLLCFSVPVIAFFLLKSIQGKVQANWAMTGYLTGLIAFSRVYISGWTRQTVLTRGLIVAGLALVMIVTAVAFYPSSLGIPARLDPTARLRGWEEVGRKVSVIQRDLRQKGDVFIFSDSYQVASELAFYVEGRPETYCINLGRRMNQYDLWPDFSGRLHSRGIFVKIDDVSLPLKVREAFKGCTKQLLTVQEKDRVLRDYSIFVCEDFFGMPREAPRSY